MKLQPVLVPFLAAFASAVPAAFSKSDSAIVAATLPSTSDSVAATVPDLHHGRNQSDYQNLERRAWIDGACTAREKEIIRSAMSSCEAIALRAADAAVSDTSNMELFFKYVHHSRYVALKC